MEKRGRGRPPKISPESLSMLKSLFGDSETSARTVRDKEYLMKTMTAGQRELNLIGEDYIGIRTQLNKRWPFSFPPYGKRVHNSLLVEIGRQEDHKSIIGVLDALEREPEKLKIKDAIQMLRDIRKRDKGLLV